MAHSPYKGSGDLEGYGGAGCGDGCPVAPPVGIQKSTKNGEKDVIR